jgi:hypothetical protein
MKKAATQAGNGQQVQVGLSLSAVLQQFHAARPTTAAIRAAADRCHHQIDQLVTGPCTRSASRSVDRYVDNADRLTAFAARLDRLEGME